MNKPPLIRAVRVLGPTTLEIVWSTGETLPVDVSRLLARYKLYAPLKTARTFRSVKPDEWGHSVYWPGDVDMSADTLYELARTQAGEWGPEAFSVWMERNGLSLNSAADALDMTRTNSSSPDRPASKARCIAQAVPPPVDCRDLASVK